MTKKILICAMIFASMLLSFSANAEESIYNEVQILESLNIIKESSEEFLPYENITKCEFYGMVANLLADNMVDNVTDTEQVKKAVHNLGMEDMTEKELCNVISCGEAVEVFLDKMGYKSQLEMKGNKSTAYMAKARVIGLLDEINASYSKKLDRITAMRMIVNAIYVEYPDFVFDGNSFKPKNTTLLIKYRDIYEVDGIVNQTGVTSLYSKEGAGTNKIGINDDVYTTNFDCTNLLGCRVTGFVKLDDGDGTVLWLSKHKKNTEVQFNSKDIVSIGKKYSQIQYSIENKTKTARLSANFKVIYNGVFLDEFTEDDFKPLIGDLRLVDNDRDNEYDVVFISSADVIVVRGYSKLRDSINGQYTYSGVLTDVCFEDYDNVTIQKDGEDIKPAEVEKNDVVRVYRSKDNKTNIYLDVCRKSISGVIDSNDSNNEEVTVDGVIYSISKEYYRAKKENDVLASNVTLGNHYSIYLDSNNEAVMFTLDTDMYASYGFIRKIYNVYDSDEYIRVRVFTMDSKWETFELAEKVKVNGEKSCRAEDAIKKLEVSDVFVPQIIMYKKDKDGRIKAIETAINQDKYDEQRLTTSGKQSMNFSRPGVCFGANRVIMMNTTKVLIIPVNKDYEDGYRIETHYYFNDNTVYTFYAYRKNNFNVPEVVVIEEDTNNLKRKTLSGELGIVLSKGTTINDDDEICEYANVMTKTYNNLNITTEKTGILDNVRVGDIISVSYNNHAQATNCNLYYSTKDGKKYLKSQNYQSQSAPVAGDITEFSEDRSMYRIWCGDEYITLRTPKEDSQVIFYDAAEKTAKKGTFADVQVGDFVFVRIAWYETNGVVVIKHK